jgi:hypothetical protein
MGKSIKNKSEYMEDGESDKNLEENLFRKSIRKIPYVSDVLQPIWVRCSPILSLYCNREFVVRKFNYVLHIGTLLWIVFLFSKII